ncbi:hypothetical protein RclHR1_01010019 [Rhizophagus clarus]|uniref:Kinase-like domain-containing protein n=1 Tax=Rhizophagus clarus TaxID=94130 RepID=A0A2Z6QRF2_9GLOM|nr:hypothetical protein RclHR1_01010019 [Rhizophagus clarus]GES82945.1 kinase-like domain-containing protein [Rhizophagus clarus]
MELSHMLHHLFIAKLVILKQLMFIVLWEICSGFKPYSGRPSDMFLLVTDRGLRPKIHSGIPSFLIPDEIVLG